MQRKEIIQHIVDYLNKSGITAGTINEGKNFEVVFKDVEILHKLLNAFRGGSCPWKLSLTNTSILAVRPPNLGSENLIREIDYKICLLKSLFGG